jgi:uncharacterized protein
VSATLAPPRVQYKTVQLSAKAAERAGTVGEFEAYVSTFGNVDQGGDRVMPGAFTATLQQRSHRPLLWDHDVGQVIGVEIAIGEDRHGLKGTWRFADTVQGRDARTLVKSGSVTSMSIGFIPQLSRKADDGARELTQVDLLECSLVALPMNMAAMIQSVKGGSMSHDFAAIERRLRDTGIIDLPRRDSFGARIASHKNLVDLAAGRAEQAIVRVPDFDAKALLTTVNAPFGTTELRADLAPGPPTSRMAIDYLPQESTASGTVSVPSGGGITGFASVAEATATTGTSGMKPELTQGAYTGQVVHVSTIAGYLPITRRILADGGAELERVLDADLRDGLKTALEAEVMAQISGWTGVPSQAATAGQMVGSLVTAITTVATNSHRVPDVLFLDYASWATLMQGMATTGAGSSIGPLGLVGPTVRILSAVVVPSGGLAAATALCGVAATAPVFTQPGVTVTAGLARDDFVRNIVRLRAEVNACAVVTRANAWLRVTGLS